MSPELPARKDLWRGTGQCIRSIDSHEVLAAFTSVRMDRVGQSKGAVGTWSSMAVLHGGTVRVRASSDLHHRRGAIGTRVTAVSEVRASEGVRRVTGVHDWSPLGSLL